VDEVETINKVDEVETIEEIKEELDENFNDDFYYDNYYNVNGFKHVDWTIFNDDENQYIKYIKQLESLVLKTRQLKECELITKLTETIIQEDKNGNKHIWKFVKDPDTAITNRKRESFFTNYDLMTRTSELLNKYLTSNVIYILKELKSSDVKHSIFTINYINEKTSNIYFQCENSFNGNINYAFVNIADAFRTKLNGKSKYPQAMYSDLINICNMNNFYLRWYYVTDDKKKTQIIDEFKQMYGTEYVMSKLEMKEGIPLAFIHLYK
jgi:hypothetical protein